MSQKLLASTNTSTPWESKFAKFTKGMKSAEKKLPVKGTIKDDIFIFWTGLNKAIALHWLQDSRAT